MDPREQKSREVRLRRAARRHGLVLERCRARHAGAPGFGTYALTKTVGTGNTRRVHVVAGDPDAYGLTLDDVEQYLRMADEETQWKRRVRMNNFQKASAGAHYAAARIARLGYSVRVVELSHGSYRLRVTNAYGDHMTIKPKTKATADGTWQETIDVTAEAEDLWVMVDMSGPGEPDYYVAPASSMVELIRREHQQYLARRAGHRRDSDASKHCAIELRTVERWRDCWHLIDDPTDAELVTT